MLLLSLHALGTLKWQQSNAEMLLTGNIDSRLTFWQWLYCGHLGRDRFARQACYPHGVMSPGGARRRKMANPNRLFC